MSHSFDIVVADPKLADAVRSALEAVSAAARANPNEKGVCFAQIVPTDDGSIRIRGGFVPYAWAATIRDQLTDMKARKG